jgi:hypothetical protein
MKPISQLAGREYEGLFPQSIVFFTVFNGQSCIDQDDKEG